MPKNSSVSGARHAMLLQPCSESLKAWFKAELWIDDWHIVGLPRGLEVFDEELVAAELMRTNELLIRDLKKCFENVLSYLVTADEKLAQKSIEEAKEIQEANKIARLQVRIAEGKYRKGLEEKSKGRFSLAILFFKQAWMHAQKVKQFAR
jgi:hypothetical protein